MKKILFENRLRKAIEALKKKFSVTIGNNDSLNIKTDSYDKSVYSKIKSILDKVNIGKYYLRQTGNPGNYQLIFEFVIKRQIKSLIKEEVKKILKEKAVSKAQQRFFGMVDAAQKGEKPASKRIGDVAKNMKKKDVKDFARTKHAGLPERVPKKENIEEKEVPWDQDRSQRKNKIKNVPKRLRDLYNKSDIQATIDSSKNSFYKMKSKKQ